MVVRSGLVDRLICFADCLSSDGSDEYVSLLADGWD